LLDNSLSKSGGYWFGESEEDVLAFAKSMRQEVSTHIIHKCKINILKPKYYDSFRNGYVEDIHHPRFDLNFQNRRENFMNWLIGKGYDSIFIDDDTWNDTGDHNSVTSKQFVVFNLNNIHPLGSPKDINGFKSFVSNGKIITPQSSTIPKKTENIYKGNDDSSIMGSIADYIFSHKLSKPEAEEIIKNSPISKERKEYLYQIEKRREV
jgi:hypothetical protein